MKNDLTMRIATGNMTVLDYLAWRAMRIGWKIQRLPKFLAYTFLPWLPDTIVFEGREERFYGFPKMWRWAGRCDELRRQGYRLTH